MIRLDPDRLIAVGNTLQANAGRCAQAMRRLPESPRLGRFGRLGSAIGDAEGRWRCTAEHTEEAASQVGRALVDHGHMLLMQDWHFAQVLAGLDGDQPCATGDTRPR